MILLIISYIATAIIIFSYAYMVKTKNVNQFNWVNFLTAAPLVILAIIAGAIPNAIISGFFGLVGLYGIIESYNDSRKEKLQKFQEEVYWGQRVMAICPDTSKINSLTDVKDGYGGMSIFIDKDRQPDFVGKNG